METINITRKELYERVWSTPMSALAKEFNVSSGRLKKICRDNDIPVPVMGYWQKLQYNKSVEKLPLPQSEKKIIITIEEQKKEEKEIVKPDKKAQPKVTKQYPKKLRNPDRLIIAHQQYIKSKDWHMEHLSISVSESLLDEALLFMDTFIKRLKAKGHNIITKYSETYAVVFGREIRIRLIEKSHRKTIIDKYWTRTELIPNGILCFKRFVPDKEWIGKKTNPLLNQIDDIIFSFEKYVRELFKIWEENKKQKEEYEKQRQFQRELKQRKENELYNFKKLFVLADRMHKTNIIREYIDKLEKSITEQGRLTTEKQKWIEWARKKADWYDPFIESDDELLSDVDKNSLTFKP